MGGRRWRPRTKQKGTHLGAMVRPPWTGRWRRRRGGTECEVHATHARPASHSRHRRTSPGRGRRCPRIPRRRRRRARESPRALARARPGSAEESAHLPRGRSCCPLPCCRPGCRFHGRYTS
eukprot:scaffold5222_cov106-Isochrysis_galbana.AAC.6